MKVMHYLLMVFAYVIWIMFTWGLLTFTIEAIRNKQIWHTIYGGIGFLCALYALAYKIIKTLC